MSKRRREIKTVLSQTIPRKARLLLCVSGGIDSMVLLHGVNSVKRLLELEVQVVHVDHQVRKDSKLDGKLVRKESEKLGLPFHLVTLDPKKQTGNFEAWARDERYKSFSGILTEYNLDWCVTAHHANDVAETFLMRVLANKELNSILEKDPERKILRPLLSVTRVQIEEYAKRFTVLFREDSTNNDMTFLRNKVRKKLIPYLEKNFGESVVPSLVARAGVSGEDELFLQELAKKEAYKISGLKWGGGEWVVQLQQMIKNTQRPVMWRIVEEVLKEKFVWSLGYNRSLEFLEWFKHGKGELHLPEKVVLRWSKSGVISHG